MSSLSAVVVTYRRLENLDTILAGWLAVTPDVWLCDCSAKGFQTALPVRIVRAVPDPGNRIRHAVALLTSGDLVFKGDDDIVPLPGIGAEFVAAYEAKGPGIYGIHGRRFLGPRYYSLTRMFGQGRTKVLTPVDFVGVITAAPRALLPMDLRGCRSEIEDLWWQMRCFPKAAKWVVPTINVHHLRESFDQGRLCGTIESRRIRERFYAQEYIRSYAKRPR